MKTKNKKIGGKEVCHDRKVRFTPMNPYKGIYINASSWCNQPSLFHKMSFAEYSMARGVGN